MDKREKARMRLALAGQGIAVDPELAMELASKVCFCLAGRPGLDDGSVKVLKQAEDLLCADEEGEPS